ACLFQNHRLQVRDVQTGKVVRSVEVPSAPPNAWRAAFAPDGSRLAIATNDGKLHIYSVTEDRHLIAARGTDCQDLAFSPDGNHLVLTTNSIVEVWQLAGNSIRLRCHIHQPQCQQALLLPRGRLLVWSAVRELK